MSSAKPPLHVAIIGGGIAGLTLGIGLQARNVSFTIYERSSGVHEIGAGIGLSPNAEWAMKCVDPRVHDAYEKVANPNGEDYFQWVNGLTKELMFKLFVGKGCFRGCRRSDFLEELMKCLPAERVRFGRALREVVELDDGTVTLVFKDGTEETADAVIGCDGIRSRLREVIFRDRPSAATYSSKFSFRALIPIEKALTRLDHAMVFTRFMYNGPGAHIITYPVANNTVLNVLAVVSDPNPWISEDGRHTGRATRDEAERAFAEWHPSIRAIIDLMPEQMDKWAIFDMLENPVPRYHSESGRLCLAGDAAHAVGPHLGAGAGFGIEDALLLAELLELVQDRSDGSGSGSGPGSLGKHLEAAFSVYSEVRHGRTQWLVKNTRDAVDLFELREAEISKDTVKFGEEITSRFHQVWYYDVEKMVKNGRQKLETCL